MSVVLARISGLDSASRESKRFPSSPSVTLGTGRKAAPPNIVPRDRVSKGTAAAKILHWRCIPSNTPSTLDDPRRFPP